MFFVLMLIVILVVLVAVNIVIVPEGRVYVIESLGKYKTSWSSGLHAKIPILDRIAKRVSIKEQVADFPPQPVITKDNVTMQIDAVVYYKVQDPKLYTYGTENPIIALENLTATTIRNIVGGMTLDKTLTSRDKINCEMCQTLDVATDPWGIKVNRVELKNINPPEDIRKAMEKQMKAEREKRETVLTSEAHKISIVTREEGNKQAKILAAEAERDAEIAVAEGKAASILKVYEAEARGLKMLKDAGIDGSVIAIKQLEALKDVANGNATKIFMPTEIADAGSRLGFIGEMLGTSPEPAKLQKKVIVPDDPCCSKKEEAAQAVASLEESK